MVIEARIKRLMLLILVAVPVVFGGLAINAYTEVKGHEALFDQIRQKRIDQADVCGKLSEDELRLSYSCSAAGKGLDVDTDKMIAEGLMYWRERLDFYVAIVAYVPLATIALYFSFKWIWFGRLGGVGKSFDASTRTERNQWRLVELLVRQKKNVGLAVLFVLLLASSFVLFPEKAYQILVGSTVQVLVVVGVVWLVKMFFRRK